MTKSLTLNVCPRCKNLECLVIEVPYTDGKGNDCFDRLRMDDGLKVIKTKNNDKRDYHDKDRIILCDDCGASDDSSDEFKIIRKLVKQINPNYL